MKKIILILSFIQVSIISSAQDEPYISITSTEPYSELVNPISVNNSEIWNEESTYPIDVDFDFIIYDQLFSSLIVNAGGGISFPNGEKHLHVYFTPFGGYYLIDKGYDTSISNIDYEVTGNDGQHIIKIQWNNAGFRQSWSTSDTSDYVDFQIWIFQEDAHLELHFGPSQTDPGTYGYPDGQSDPNPGPSILFHFDDCHDVLSYIYAADNPTSGLFYWCWPPEYTFIDGTPSDGITYSIIPVSLSNCLINGIVFEYQAEIDSFQINHPGCNTIEGNVRIEGDDISNLNGLSVLNSIGNDLIIESNSSLSDLSGLENISSISGNLEIRNNSSLLNLSAFDNLSTIDGSLVIVGNEMISSLSGLENIEANSISNLSISMNNQLSYCEIQSICEYIANPNSVIEIENNAIGCNNQQEVLEACQTVGINDNKPQFDVSVFPNPATNDIFIKNINGEITYFYVTIYNNIGQIVFMEKQQSNSIDVSSLKQGIYFIELSSDELKIRKKIVINK